MFKPIPEDTGSFLKIRTAQPQMLYVDKTAYLHRLVTSGRTCVFLARPRRFGQCADATGYENFDKDMDWASQLGGDLLCGEFDRFFRGLKSLYAGVPYGSTEETVHEASSFP